MNFGKALGEHLKMVASASMFYITIDRKNKTNMKVGAININIKIHQLFSKQQIFGICVIFIQWEILGDLTQTCS